MPVKLISCHLAVFILLLWSAAVAASPPVPLDDGSTQITIDPGHGGRDKGARGTNGLLEKDVSLELARKLTLKLETQYKITLTRSDDYDVEPRHRAAIANQSRSKLFVSIHTGASFLHAAKGITIYYYAPHKSPPPENPKEKAANGTPMAWNETHLRHKKASISIATILKTHLEKMTGEKNCNIQSAPLVVLEGADMPAVLIEIGYITHPETEKKLSTPSHLDQLVRTLFEGIDEYMVNYAAP